MGHFCENGILDSSFAESIAVSLFGWSEQIQFKSSPNRYRSIRRQDPNSYSDTEMRALSNKEWLLRLEILQTFDQSSVENKMAVKDSILSITSDVNQWMDVQLDWWRWRWSYIKSTSLPSIRIWWCIASMIIIPVFFLRNSASSFHWLSSSIFNVRRSFVPHVSTYRHNMMFWTIQTIHFQKADVSTIHWPPNHTSQSDTSFFSLRAQILAKFFSTQNRFCDKTA